MAGFYSLVLAGFLADDYTEVISRSTQNMISAQMSAATDIISSQDRIAESIDNVSYAIDDIKNGLASLAAAFEWGISQVVWQLEQNREVLQNIMQILSAPLDTQARELKQRADEAYINEWFDDALTDYHASEEKNKYDFTIHISLGMIYLFNVINKEKAFEYFEKAVKYSKPKSSYHASFALLHKALCLRDMNRLQEALRCSEEAYELTRNMAEAYYQTSLYNALLEHQADNVTRSLCIALDYDKFYALKANNEPAFNYIREEINACIVTAKDSNYNFVKKALLGWSNTYDKWISLINKISSDLPTINAHSLEKSQTIIERINKLINRNSFFDSVEAKENLTELEQQELIIRNNLKKQLQDSVKNVDVKLNHAIHNFVTTTRIRLKRNTTRATVLRYISLAALLSIVVGCTIQNILNPHNDGSLYYPIALFGGILGLIVSWISYQNANQYLVWPDDKLYNSLQKTNEIIKYETDTEKANSYLNDL